MTRALVVLVIAACGGNGREELPPVVRVELPGDAMAIDAAPIPPPREGELVVAGPAAFYLDRAAVTNAGYLQCIAANACTPRPGKLDPSAPVADARLDEARAYCAWRGQRLPTLAEWQRAGITDAAETWTDAGAPSFRRRCVVAPSRKADIVRGSEHSEVSVDDLRGAGLRCARSVVADPPIVLDEDVLAITDAGWIAASPVKTATAAMQHVTCDLGDTPIALADRWLVARTAATTKPAAEAAKLDTEVVEKVPAGLVRVVGTAHCRDDHDLPQQATLTVQVAKRRWRFELDGTYQLWLEAGALATFTLACPPIECNSQRECAPGYAGNTTATFRVPASPASGLVGPQLQRFGGCTCD